MAENLATSEWRGCAVAERRGARTDLSDATAALLVGGLGTRLAPAVADRPKALAQVSGRPFLAHLLDCLARAGIRRAVLCTGHRGAQVRAAFGDAYHGIGLVYSHEDEPAGTGGALRLALPLLDSDPVLVLNGDSLCDAALDDLWCWHGAREARITVLLASVHDPRRYGHVELDRHACVERFDEKGAAAGPGWVNAGVYIVARSVVAEIPPDQAVSLERDVLPAWIGRGLFGYRSGASFVDIGTPDAYAAAPEFVRELRVRSGLAAGGRP